MQDLETDFQERQSKATDQPKSLWQEVYDIGEEFVEFLEQEVGGRERRASKTEAKRSGSRHHPKHPRVHCQCNPPRQPESP